MVDKQIVTDLKLSARQFGRLYPVLLDRDGNVLDGNHRLKADPNWPKMKLENVKTEEDRLVVKLISNLCRRNVSAAEKTQIVGALARAYLKQGVKPGQLGLKIAERTGMSYRWAMNYLPDDLKMYPGRGGPSKTSAFTKCKNESNFCKVAAPATLLSDLCSNSGENIVTVMNYANTRFVNVLLDKKTYSRIERAARNLGIKPESVIGNALLSALRGLAAYGYAKEYEKSGQILVSASTRKADRKLS